MKGKSSRQERVNQIFSSIARKYDLMNDLMTFGFQRSWKQIMVNHIIPKKNFHLLDMACGTGDISFSFFEILFQNLKNYLELLQGHNL